VEGVVIQLCREKLGIDVQPQDIVAAHRLKKGQKDASRPILVRFLNRKLRDRILRSRSTLKSTYTASPADNIYISEHLTHTVSKLFYDARSCVKAKKIYSAWTANGKVLIRRTNNPTEKPTVILANCELPK
jgi:hypothetical protein